MTHLRLIMRSLCYFRRTHAGVLSGTAIGAAVLTGALLTGDSVRGTLQDIAMARIGQVQSAMSSNDRFFRSELADNFENAAAVLIVNATATTPNASARANRVQLLGVDDQFWQLSPANSPPIQLDEDQIAINQQLAEQLCVGPDDFIILRVEKPSLLPRDMPLAQTDDATASMRLKVKIIVSDDQFGRFNLLANQAQPHNAFVSRQMLADKLGLANKVNLLLTAMSANDAASRLRDHWTIEDAQLATHLNVDHGHIQISSPRVFIDQVYANAFEDATLVLTYFVNQIRVNDRIAPYSTVTAITGTDFQRDQMLINQWLANDLKVKIGDKVELTYYLPGAGRQLTEQSHTFEVAGILPMDDPAMDRSLMPDFPGLSDAEHCREWDAGFPVDYDLIREKDEAYWSQYQGTPKAIIDYDAGKAIWGNRFGALTAIRVGTDVDVQQVIADKIDPARAGFTFTDIRKHALEGASQSMDFGALFLSMSFFLIVAAAILTGLLFVFGIEQRSREIGTLLAVGWLKPTIGRVLMLEGFILAIVGSAIGCLLGIMYTRAILHALNSVWQDAVTSAKLQFHSQTSSLAIGFGTSVAIAVITMWLAMRKSLKQPAIGLLTGQNRLQVAGSSPAMLSRWIATTTMLTAIILLWWSRSASSAQAAGMFFGVGALLLIATIATCRGIACGYRGRLLRGGLSLVELAIGQATRRRERSLAIITLIACGSFMVIAVGANRQDISSQYQQQSGSGGFRLYGETALPLLNDLNTESGREAFAIDDNDMQQINIVSLRLREGDDASCLNLNSVRSPRLLGIDPAKLADRFGDVDWSILDDLHGDTIPVIGDDATITWSLYKKVGDTLDYIAQNGQTVQLRIVAVIPNSIFQGSLLMSETAFEQMFTSHSGYHVLLIDVPDANASIASEMLTRSLSDIGLQITPAGKRLAMFNRVQNTYLSIFAALGGLGLILGSVGLGAVVLRNIFERRSELAAMSAMGFTRRRLFLLILLEHSLLLEVGLACGTFCAIVAVWPAIRGSRAEIPFGLLIGLIITIWLSGLAWVVLATLLSLRGKLIDALRSE